jgi:hypothetical protein
MNSDTATASSDVGSPGNDILGPSRTSPTDKTLGWSGAGFAATILISAFLLFQVQPLISKVILPWFGGTPAVWTTCMLFFQVLLLGGYAYAHLLQRLAPLWVQATLHSVLLVVALTTLPITPDPSWKPLAAANPTWRILCLLAINVGTPYLMLSATGPLVQSWFSWALPHRSPYRLYALSNLGSLAALVSYPFLVEPHMTVGLQAAVWSWGFAVFAVLCGCCGILTWRWGRHSTQVAQSDPRITALASGRLRRWGAWIALPALASMALLATTNHVCQDVAVIPFLWVVPLSVYLLSFVVAFDHERWYQRWLFASIVAGAAVLISSLDAFVFSLGFAVELSLYFAALFCLCMVCHGELVRLRPPPAFLTSFYLAISVGGALGGMFVSIVAPTVFSSYVEWKITLVAGFLLAVGLLLRSAWNGPRPWVKSIPVLACGVLGLAVIAYAQSWFGGGVERTRLTTLYNAGYRTSTIERSRDFYGVTTVLERVHESTSDLNDRMMLSGQIPHGLQFSSPSRRRMLTSYFGPETGVGKTLVWVNQQPQAHVGIVGLGAGTLANYAQADQRYRYYEINPAVERLARKHFWSLGDCRGKLDVVLGDARLSMEREPPQNFSALVLDAFSGDAIPTHLLTAEAFATYRKHLAPNGIIAVHVSNGYLDLQPVVQGLATKYGFDMIRVSTRADDSRTLYTATWLLLSQDPRFLLAQGQPAQPDNAPSPSILWTDSYSNLFSILK